MKVLVPESHEERAARGIEARGLECGVVAYGEGRLGPFPGAEVFFWAWPSAVRRQALAAAPDLRWVHTASAGVDGLVPVVRERGLALTESGVCYGPPISEFVMGLVLHAAKRLGEHWEASRGGRWQGFGHRELLGRTMGIVGLGPIGLALADRAAAFGMRVIGCRRSGRPVAGVAEVVGPEGLARLLGESDYVALACPLTAETRGLLGREAIRAMRPGAVLVNIARGALVDTEALAEALCEGRIGGACLDVTDPEPLPEGHPLWRAPNALVTSHSAGGGDEALFGRIAERFLGNLERYLAGRPLEGLVDLDRGY